eukprot:244498-Rhodomonas_salina.1
MPYRFWPWAVTQFCRIYKYWPSHGHAPPWILLEGHHFSLHPFGCYTIGKLPREHLDVVDTTNSDQGLKGAFLGWDLQTPTVWIWSFRKRKLIRLHDPIFYDSKFPFADPSVLINQDLTAAKVTLMHDFDATNTVPESPAEVATNRVPLAGPSIAETPLPSGEGADNAPPVSGESVGSRTRSRNQQVQADVPILEADLAETPQAKQDSVLDPLREDRRNECRILTTPLPGCQVQMSLSQRPCLSSRTSSWDAHWFTTSSSSNCHVSGGTTANRRSTRRAQQWRLHATRLMATT